LGIDRYFSAVNSESLGRIIVLKKKITIIYSAASPLKISLPSPMVDAVRHIADTTI
jgi:hypothetical protein